MNKKFVYQVGNNKKVKKKWKIWLHSVCQEHCTSIRMMPAHLENHIHVYLYKQTGLFYCAMPNTNVF